MESSSYDVYEEHLKHLEEQLVTVTIENQNLALELQGYKDKESLSRLKTEIEIERSRFFKLEEKYKKLEKDYENQNVHSVDTAQGWVDVSLKSGKSKPVTNQSKVLGNTVLTNKADRIWKRAVQRVYTILDDFAEELEEEPETDEGPTLTVKQLKENINRFSADFKPYVDTVKGIQQMLAWKTPSYTLLMFMIFLISVWHGCLMSVILFCLVFRLTISLLNHLGFQINFNFFQPLAEPKSKEETSLGLSDKFNLVIQVARKVQNGLGAAADGLEKIQSLFTWRTPVTKKLYLMLFVGFVVSLFPAATADYSYIIGISIGVKIFIVNYFYNRYPRLNRKYNSSYKTWQKLPTNAQYEKTCIKSEINQYVLSDSDKLPIKRQSSIKRAQVKEADKDFCQLFSLPNSESPLEGWQGGRRCSLINKDKSVLSAFKNGRLYLTRSFLCFERKKTPSKKNLVIPLGDIVDVSKVKPYSVLPGSGMALEVKVQGDKAFTFGAIVNRDDAYDSLILAGIEQNLSWATGPVTPNTTPTTPTSSLRRRGSSRISNFTWASDYVDTE